MAGSGKSYKNKTYFNHNSMNELLLIVYTMALTFPTHSSTLEAEFNKFSCTDSMTCTKCTINPMCVWYLKQQECENKNKFNSSSLIISRKEECPQFSAVTTYQYDDNKYISVKYIVKIKNDLVGFINYLNKTQLYLEIQPDFRTPVTIVNETNILCSFRQTKLSVSLVPDTSFFLIKFNDTMLRFDNVADHYVTVYGLKECSAHQNYIACATCGWYKNGYSNYLKLCSSENTCKDKKSLYIKNNAKNQSNEKVAYVTNDCAEINVSTVDPLSGPETGGTTVTIIVRNHWIFEESRTVMVTVAGTECLNPRTSGLETITCTTTQSVGTLSGPIVVEYSSIETVLRIESSQIFRFCMKPVLDAYQLLVGIVSGGTSVSVCGNHFLEPCVVSSARLYVDLPDGIRWYAYGFCDPPVNNTYMVCRSPRMNSTRWNGNQSVVGRLLNFGLDVMKFTGNQSLHVNGTSLSFYVQPDPILQDFVIDEAGSVIINGINLENVQLDDVVVRFLNSSATGCVVVSVKSKRIICNPAITITSVELYEILVDIGDSLSYSLVNRSPTPIIDPFNLQILKNPFISGSNKTSCSDSITCTKCTIRAMCIWSLQQQTCVNKTQFSSSGLIVFRIEECPRFSVVKEYNYGESSVTLKYIAKLSNDLVGFKNYLNNCILYNRYPTYCKYPTRKVNSYNNTIISCEFYLKKSYFDSSNPSFTFFTFINFNDVMLRFDNVADHYATFNEHEECTSDEKYKSCVTCAWNNDGYSNYLRWCSSDNTCQVPKSLYMKNNGIEQLNVKLAHLTNDCAEINVTEVDPLFGPETGGTTVTITVKNHMILAENRTVMVTIAGTVCMNPRTSGPETITCSTSQPNITLSGPVLVEYSSFEIVLKIESSQIFQFCLNPVLDADQLLGGIVSGGISVPVHGNHFAELCFAYRLYVDLADDIRQYADSYCDSPVNETYMVCQTPSVNGTGWDVDASIVGRLLNFGLEITFNKDNTSVNQSLPIVIRGPSPKFYVHPDPVLLDFEINGSGSLVVHGHHLQHVPPEDIVIRSTNSLFPVCVAILVTRNSFVCETTMPVTELQEISVKMGKWLVFKVIRNTLTHPEDPFKLSGWFLTIISISTVMVFVWALACCLRTKQLNVTENIRNPLGASTRSHDLIEHTAL
ncbi:PREDICTED: uncharacterized protein LOC107165814 isoform X2 [Diuraphis noxia]|nr:PREDICTED: uncharacterized protein LOC107165814 isoform X2 [Diuraphis noxia]